MAVKHKKTYAGGSTKVTGADWDDSHTADNGEFYETGDWKFAGRKSVQAGWIASSTATIGNVGSGATYANAAALALFTLWWTEWTNAELPILTSAGAGSTRGASAADDWAALKRMSVLGTADRVLRVPGAIQAAGAQLEASQVFDAGTYSGGAITADGFGILNEDSSGGQPTTIKVVTAGTNTSVTASYGAVRVASIGIPGFWKL